MRWPPNPWPSGNCLTSWLPELLWVLGCFQFRPCRAHIPAASLRCVSRSDGPATPHPENLPAMYKKHGIQKDGSKCRRLMPGHRLCDKDPSHLKLGESPSFSVLIYVVVDGCIFNFSTAVNHWLALLDHRIVRSFCGYCSFLLLIYKRREQVP